MMAFRFSEITNAIGKAQGFCEIAETKMRSSRRMDSRLCRSVRNRHICGIARSNSAEACIREV